MQPCPIQGCPDGHFGGRSWMDRRSWMTRERPTPVASAGPACAPVSESTRPKRTQISQWPMPPAVWQCGACCTMVDGRQEGIQSSQQDALRRTVGFLSCVGPHNKDNITRRTASHPKTIRVKWEQHTSLRWFGTWRDQIGHGRFFLADTGTTDCLFDAPASPWVWDIPRRGGHRLTGYVTIGARGRSEAARCEGEPDHPVVIR